MIKNILFLVLTYIIPFCVYAQFSSETVKRIDVIENNSASNITLSPDSSVIVDNFTGSFALQSGASGELQESSVSSIELGYLSGVTSLLQGQLDAKIDEPSGSSAGDILFYNGVSSEYARLAIGAPNYVLTATPAGVPNWLPLPAGSPTTTAGDIIYNDAGGTATDTRLPIGSESQVLTVSSGLPSWQDAADPSPTTTLGDLIRRGASADERLGIGSNDQVLTVVSGQPEWADLGESVSVTTKGDLQTYSTTPDRLPVGTDGQVLVADSAEATGLKWSDANTTGIQDRAGFITWSAGDIAENDTFKIADGQCVSKTEYPDLLANIGITYGECDAGAGAGSGLNLPDLITDNRFIRSSGGSLSVGQTQSATEIYDQYNGARVPDGASGVRNGENTVSISTATIAITNFTTSTVNRNFQAVRPINMAMKPFIRVRNAEAIVLDASQIGKWECQTKFLSGDVTSADTSAFSSLQFNNLTIGKSYELYFKGLFDVTNGDSVANATAANGASNLIRINSGNTGSGLAEHSASGVKKFVATATTITYSRGSFSAGSLLRGNGGSNETEATLCELPDNYVLNSTKFN